MAADRVPDEQAAHDVLAAEEFAVPAPDPGLIRRSAVLPEDPTGIAEPHDILAAEEFAMPAPAAEARTGVLSRPVSPPWRRRIGAAAMLAALIGLRRRRR